MGRRAGDGGHQISGFPQEPAMACSATFSRMITKTMGEWTAMGNIDFLHGSPRDLLHGRQPGMDRIVAMWVLFFADRIDR